MNNTPSLNEKLPPLIPGDIVLTNNRAFDGDTTFARLIGWFESWKDKAPADATHVAGSLGGHEIIESLGKVTRGSVWKYADIPIRVWRLKGIGYDKRVNIAARWDTVEHQKYAWTKIPLFALDSLFSTYFFTRTFGLSSFKVCSNLIAWAYEKEVGYKFGAVWRSISPDDIDDFCAEHPEWGLVWDSMGGNPNHV